MTLAALKPSFDLDFADRAAAPRASAEITTLNFAKSEASAEGFAGETLGAKFGYSLIGAYALFNAAFVVTHFII
jgi:hypothetical protein